MAAVDGRDVLHHHGGDGGGRPKLTQRPDDLGAADHADQPLTAVDDRKHVLAGLQQGLDRGIDMLVRASQRGEDFVIMAAVIGTSRDIARSDTTCASEAAAR